MLTPHTNSSDLARELKPNVLYKIPVLYDTKADLDYKFLTSDPIVIPFFVASSIRGLNETKFKAKLSAVLDRIYKLNPEAILIDSQTTFNILNNRDVNSPVTKSDLLPGNKKFIAVHTSGGSGTLQEAITLIKLFLERDKDA